MIFSKVKLATKLTGGILFVALIGAVVGFYALLELKAADARTSSMHNDMLVPVYHAGEIATHFHRMRNNLERVVQTGATPEEIRSNMEKVAERNQAISGHYDELAQSMVTPEAKKLVAAYEEQEKKFDGVMNRALDLAKSGDQPAALALVHGQLEELRVTYQDAIDRMSDYLISEAEETEEIASTQGDRAARIVYILLGISICVGIGVAVVISRDIANQVGGEPRNIRIFANKIAGGDLTLASLDDSKVTGISQAVGRMNNALKSLIVPMSTNMAGLATASQQVTDVAATLRRATAESAAKSNSVSSSAEKMYENMNSVAAAVEQTTTNVNAVAAAAEELTATIGEIAMRASDARTISEGAVSTARETAAIIDELEDAADEIGKVTSAITGISDQTKLLALNATIEAARAGEAGKGFAVVANEIKELARQAAEATGDISNRVGAIRNSTDRTKKGIGTMGGVINNVNDAILTIASAVEEQAVTVSEIARNAQEVSYAVGESASMVAQTSVAASEVVQEITVLHAETEAIASSTTQLDQSAENLQRMAGEMGVLVGKFKI